MPSPSYLVNQFKNESSAKLNIVHEKEFDLYEMNLCSKTFPYGWSHTNTRFETGLQNDCLRKLEQRVNGNRRVTNGFIK